jgi:hypothetical protein
VKALYAVALALAEALRTVRDLVRPGVYVGPRACTRCGKTTDRVDGTQYEALLFSAQRGAPVLACWCGGILRPLLELAANPVHPDHSSGLDRVRARTTSTPADAAAEADQHAPTRSEQ